MMSISSQAGRRHARALDAMQKAGRAFNKSGEDYGSGGEAYCAFKRAESEFHQASVAVAKELMASGFHEMEGES